MSGLILELLVIAAITGLATPQAVFGEATPAVQILLDKELLKHEREGQPIREIVIAWFEPPEMVPKLKDGSCPDNYKHRSDRAICLLATKYHQLPIYAINKYQTVKYCGDLHAAGCYQFYDQAIYIVDGAWDAVPQNGGCSLANHELNHAKGLTHIWMEENQNNHECSAKLRNR